jgi:hypothetical protein
LADFILPPCCLVQIGQDCATPWSTPFMGRKRNQGALRGGCVTSLGSWFWLSSCLRARSPPGRLLNTSIFSLFNLFFHRVLLTPISSEVRLLLARGTTWKWTTAASVLSACPRSPLTCPSVIATHTRDSVDSLRVHHRCLGRSSPNMRWSLTAARLLLLPALTHALPHQPLRQGTLPVNNPSLRVSRPD